MTTLFDGDQTAATAAPAAPSGARRPYEHAPPHLPPPAARILAQHERREREAAEAREAADAERRRREQAIFDRAAAAREAEAQYAERRARHEAERDAAVADLDAAAERFRQIRAALAEPAERDRRDLDAAVRRLAEAHGECWRLAGAAAAADVEAAREGALEARSAWIRDHPGGHDLDRLMLGRIEADTRYPRRRDGLPLLDREALLRARGLPTAERVAVADLAPAALLDAIDAERATLGLPPLARPDADPAAGSPWGGRR